ncbi:uncharacterized protein LOC109541965 [Dendroctonus ponderosae]
MKSASTFTVCFIATALCLVAAQQYVPIPIYIPTIVVNQTVPANQSQYNGTGYRPPGAYSPYPGNQFSNYTQYNRSSNSSYNGTLDGHLFAGQVQLYDRLLFNQVYVKEKRWWTYREKIIEYPSALPAGYTRHETISAIRIYNQFLDGNSARATILKGGTGYQYVKIRLESKYNKGFKYLVQIYGH